MLRVGFAGWRGMVGSVLMQRMREESDFAGIEPVFFTTSNVGGAAPAEAGPNGALADAYDLKALTTCQAIVSCQGGEYTQKVYADLRKSGWTGYWIDAASTLRMVDHSVIILDPVNREVIDRALDSGVKDYIGGNCTVSLMLMAMGGLFREGLVEWVSSMTYQAASGGGAAKMLELMKQMSVLNAAAANGTDALTVDRAVTAAQRSAALPVEEFGAPLAGSLLAWIDKDMPGGQTKEEWKAEAEANKILGSAKTIPIDGICVRIGTLRCHSQGLVVKMTRDVPLHDVESILASSSAWTKIVPNTKDATLRDLTPAAVSGTLTVPVGRLHKLRMGPEYLGAFTVGDQLLWGAAEPLRRMLNILKERM